MNYTHNYYKLGNKIYTTIRKGIKPYQKQGFIENEKLFGVINHKSLILRIEKKIILDNVQESFLIQDCLYPNSKIDNRQKCYELFQSFYYTKIDFSKQEFYLFLMFKV